MGSQDSETQDVPHSELDSDYVPSEMSEDRAFLASDTEELSYVSDNSSNMEDFVMSIIYDYSSHGDRKIPSLEKKLIKAIAKREITRNGQLRTEYLVLWCSWESLNLWDGKQNRNQ
ncbi:uncharacterized protein N7515_001173 [Penicillium bovifimosum]|uniref:Uncharacterized protein n=1 Tax=Penicillium bovifimosum TaxID=126998 RepID=A0A9W9HGA1_9EURO|nr:uncharacterized protein N7515_001173 [Penicillium bovifimosum]KAJ5146609.1 hypothetical protein N7515_001173 [Penicillium bovifimosum]